MESSRLPLQHMLERSVLAVQGAKVRAPYVRQHHGRGACSRIVTHICLITAVAAGRKEGFAREMWP